MSATPHYTSAPDAVRVYETFVSNVMLALAARGLVWTEAEVGTAARASQAGRPKYDAIAALTGLTRRTLENILNTRNQPSMVGAAAIARALGVSLDELCGLAPTWGFTPDQSAVAVGEDGKDVGATPSPRMQCIHTSRWPPGLTVCPSCLEKWTSYQSRLRALYEANRREATAAADIRNEERKARVAARGQDPDDVKR